MPHEFSLPISEPRPRRCNGIGFHVRNTSESIPIAISGMSVCGRVPSRVRVLCSRSPTVLQKGKFWDWRNYVEVFDRSDVPLSAMEPTDIDFTLEVPLAPGEARTLYLYNYDEVTIIDGEFRVDPKGSGNGGLSYKRFRKSLCCQDEHIEVHMGNGNFGGIFQLLIIVSRGRRRKRTISLRSPAWHAPFSRPCARFGLPRRPSPHS